jgi:tripartite-type tricarboxylate transporter receptor subunit TctC
MAVALSTALISGPASAQDFPNRPITWVVTGTPGSVTDIGARTYAKVLTEKLGQSFVIDNKPGAGGTIGADLVAKAPADGHTLLLATSSTHSIGPALNPKMPYDAFKDFAPIAHVANAPSVLVVGAGFPKGNALDLIKMLKANPGKYNFGSSGIGTYPHLSAEMFKWRAGGLFVVHIPYRGTGLVVTDLIAGQITFLMDSIVSAQTHIKDGRVRALAVTGAQRSGSLPDVPTFTELGVPGLAFSNWFGFFAPAGTPADVVQRANRELNTLMRAPDVADRLRQLGADPVTGTPEAFAKVIRDEHDSWKAVIQRAGIKAE